MSESNSIDIAHIGSEGFPERRSEQRTKVVDFHYHLLMEDCFPSEMWQVLVRQLQQHVTGDRSTGQELRSEFFSKIWDPDGERALAKMNECGIDVSTLLAADFGLAFREAPVSILEQNRRIAALAKKHPDRFKAFCVVDPCRKDAVDILDRCINEFGMIAVGECHPDTGWAPNGREAYRMYERLLEWKVPVLTHTGLFFPPLQSRLDHPLLLDDVCCDFPDLVVIAAHSGRLLWWKTVAHLAAIHPNLYGDLAGFQTVALSNFSLFCQILREYIDIAGARKILWATDDPIYNQVGASTKAYVDLVRKLPEQSAEGITFTRHEVDLILGGNAQRILGI